MLNMKRLMKRTRHGSKVLHELDRVILSVYRKFESAKLRII